MNRLKLSLLAALAAVLSFAAFAPAAQAAGAVMCAPQTSVAASGPRLVTNPNTSTSYAIGPFGCAYVALADVAYFQSQGFSYGPDSGTIVYNTGVATGTTNFVIGNLPANAYISQVVVFNSTANAVTGNISIGSTANGVDVVASLVCGANCLASAPGTTTIAKAIFSTTAATPLNMAAITAWNNANVNITVVYRYF